MRKRVVRTTLIVGPDPHDLCGRAYGQRLERDRTIKCENHGVEPKAECEGEDDHGREPGISAQHPGAVAHVLHAVLEPHQATLIAAALFDLFLTAETSSRG